jgi:hypothetical protein
MEQDAEKRPMPSADPQAGAAYLCADADWLDVTGDDARFIAWNVELAAVV